MTTPDTVTPIADAPQFLEPPKWPKVVGIISVAWGVISIGCAGCGLAGAASGSFMGDMMKQQFDDGLPPQFTQGVSVVMIAASAVSAVVAVLLIAAGCVLLARKYAARILHLAWVAAAVLSALWGTYIQLGISQETKQWVRDNPNTKFAQAQNQSGAGVLEAAGWALGLAVSLGYPIFCGVWFGFVKTKPEEYTQGVEQLM